MAARRGPIVPRSGDLFSCCSVLIIAARPETFPRLLMKESCRFLRFCPRPARSGLAGLFLTYPDQPRRLFVCIIRAHFAFAQVVSANARPLFHDRAFPVAILREDTDEGDWFLNAEIRRLDLAMDKSLRIEFHFFRPLWMQTRLGICTKN